MRLIDADSLIEEIGIALKDNPHSDARIRRNHDTEHMHFMRLVSAQPTAFDKEKVMKEIKEYQEDAKDWARKPIEKAEEFQIYADAYNRCLRIVEEGGIE